MVNRSFNLRPSRLAIVFQLSILSIITALLYLLLPLWAWFICCLVAVLSYLWCLRLPPAMQLEYLADRDWTLSCLGLDVVKHVQISHVIDHQVYMVVYFQHFQEKPLLIWCDQVSWQEWKHLKLLAKVQ